MKSLSSKRSFSRRRKIIIAVVVLLLISAGVGAYFYNKKRQDEALKKEQESSKTTSASEKDSVKKSKASSSSSETLPKNSTTTTSEQIPTSSSLSVSISSVSQVDGMITATAKTNGSGSCVFMYSVGDKDKPVTRQVDIQNNSCSTSISQNEFSYTGSPWVLKITYYNGNNKAEASQSVKIN